MNLKIFIIDLLILFPSFVSAIIVNNPTGVELAVCKYIYCSLCKLRIFYFRSSTLLLQEQSSINRGRVQDDSLCQSPPPFQYPVLNSRTL